MAVESYSIANSKVIDLMILYVFWGSFSSSGARRLRGQPKSSDPVIHGMWVAGGPCYSAGVLEYDTQVLSLPLRVTFKFERFHTIQ